ncbi:MAG TPA: DUF2905 domain-containing protein [Candidatus Dadabacteria bacterium]|nr:DUF2905 domain-containing protein [Candidatus Dadabacteria bacterium]
MSFSKLLILIGVFLIVFGLTYEFIAAFFSKKIPLDIKIEKENMTIFIPIGTSIIISIVLSLILYLFNRS